MSEPIHSVPDSPSHRFRFSLRGMMFAVAVIAVLCSLWIPTIKLMVTGKAPRFGELFILGSLLLTEATLVYYIALAGIVVRGVIKPANASKRLRSLLIFAPVILFFVLLYTSLLVAALAQLPWI